MKAYSIRILLFLVGLLPLAASIPEVFPAEVAGLPAPAALRKMMKEGNFKEAYEGMRKLTLSAEVDPKQVGPVMHAAIECLQRLGRVDQIDTYREAVIQRHADNWRLLAAAARNYMEVEHTVQHFRSATWLPELLDRNGWTGMESEERVIKRAQDKVNDLVASYEKPDVDDDMLSKLRAVVERARKELT